MRTVGNDLVRHQLHENRKWYLLIGTLLVIFGFIELVIFAWIFGMTKGWEEITRGAEIKVPGFFKFIIKFVTPLFLGIILVSNIPNMVKRVWYPSSGYATFAQVYLLSLLLFILAGIFIASRQRKKANIQ